MMTVLELENLISSGEGYNTEFKVSFPSKVKEITEEICAFANAAGGTPVSYTHLTLPTIYSV